MPPTNFLHVSLLSPTVPPPLHNPLPPPLRNDTEGEADSLLYPCSYKGICSACGDETPARMWVMSPYHTEIKEVPACLSCPTLFSYFSNAYAKRGKAFKYGYYVLPHESDTHMLLFASDTYSIDDDAAGEPPCPTSKWLQEIVQSRGNTYPDFGYSVLLKVRKTKGNILAGRPQNVEIDMGSTRNIADIRNIVMADSQSFEKQRTYLEELDHRQYIANRRLRPADAAYNARYEAWIKGAEDDEWGLYKWREEEEEEEDV
jgi:hypothetical protein